MKAKAVAYVRVSTDQQADRGVSLEAQTAKVRAMATVKEAELLDVIVDAGESAKNLQRPGMARLLELVDRKAVDVVIIAKLDRLTRSVGDLAELLTRFKKRGVTLVSVADSLDTKSAAGRLVLNVMMSVAQWEREAVSERTRDALRLKQAKGERIGTVPFGHQLGTDGRTLEPHAGEQRVLTMIREWRDAGSSLRGIAVELNRQGLTTRRGGRWAHQYVASLLKAEAQPGDLAEAA